MDVQVVPPNRRVNIIIVNAKLAKQTHKYIGRMTNYTCIAVILPGSRLSSAISITLNKFTVMCV